MENPWYFVASNGFFQVKILGTGFKLPSSLALEFFFGSQVGPENSPTIVTMVIYDIYIYNIIYIYDIWLVVWNMFF